MSLRYLNEIVHVTLIYRSNILTFLLASIPKIVDISDRKHNVVQQKHFQRIKNDSLTHHKV